jgi:hypothetical protein
MPVLHRNSINGKFYVRTAFSGVPVTFQTKHWCHKKLTGQSRKDGDEISWRDFYDLWEAGGLWTRSGRTVIEQTDPLFTWAELERKIADLSKQLVETQIKNGALETKLTEERLKVSSLESDCHQWNDAYQAIEADLNMAKDHTASAVPRLKGAKAQRNVALVLFVVALLALLGLLLWHFI